MCAQSVLHVGAAALVRYMGVGYPQEGGRPFPREMVLEFCAIETCASPQVLHGVAVPCSVLFRALRVQSLRHIVSAPVRARNSDACKKPRTENPPAD